MNQSFGKKMNSQKSKKTLLLEFPIFLTGLNGSTNFLSRPVLMNQLLREKDKNSRGQKTSYQFFLFSCRS
ncbi:conserved hypothetical protein [Carnobacterium maltaromaticum]|nr:conserved hypothetical protein [Carnobacterium maltaromaticum]